MLIGAILSAFTAFWLTPSAKVELLGVLKVSLEVMLTVALKRPPVTWFQLGEAHLTNCVLHIDHSILPILNANPK